jgi:hypothetical protein
MKNFFLQRVSGFVYIVASILGLLFIAGCSSQILSAEPGENGDTISEELPDFPIVFDWKMVQESNGTTGTILMTEKDNADSLHYSFDPGDGSSPLTGKFGNYYDPASNYYSKIGLRYAYKKPGKYGFRVQLSRARHSTPTESRGTVIVG